MRFCLLIALFLLPAFISYSQPPAKDKKEDKEMNIDLPDETEETGLIKPGEWQVEAGYLYNKFQDGEAAHIAMAIVKYGFSKRLELRLLAEDGKLRDRYMEETVQSTYPLAASAKISILSDHRSLPDVTFVTYLKLPFTARSNDQNAYLSPIFLLAFQNKFGKKWKLEYNAGIQQEAYSKHWVWLGNASLHYKVIKPLEIFIEYYAQYDNQATPQHNTGLGITWQFDENITAFAAAGTTVDYESPNHFYTTGLAVRIAK